MNPKQADISTGHFLSGDQLCSLAGISSLKEVVARFFPFHRAQSGAGVQQTFDLLASEVDLTVDQIPSGTEVGDWVVPEQWEFRSATITTEDGEVVVDASESNLHVFNGSVPVCKEMDFQKLKEHLSVHPLLSDAIHYRTAFFQNDWGICVTESQLKELEQANGKLSVRIDSEYRPGVMPIAESYLAGTSGKDVLVWVHTCHPSLADDNLSSLAVAVGLIRWLGSLKSRRYGYRFVFGPATIGPIAWWHQNKESIATKKMDLECGLVLSLLGSGQKNHYKLSPDGETFFDRWFRSKPEMEIHPFEPWGYDERQWNSPGIRIPTGRFSRQLPGQFDQYHSSQDNLEFLSESVLRSSLQEIAGAFSALESNRVPVNLFPFGEPQLGRRQLYRAYGQEGGPDPDLQKAVMWILSQADGCNDLMDIASRANVPFNLVSEAFGVLFDHGLVKDSGQKSTKPLF